MCPLNFSSDIATVIYKSVDGFDVTEVPDGFVIYDGNNGKVHHLNSVAAVVYALCDGSRTVAELETVVRSLYDHETDEDLALSDFLQDLEKARLVCRQE